MKTHPLAFPPRMVMAVLLLAGAGLQASESDDRITAAFTGSHVYKTYLKDDAVKPMVKDGVLTLTGTVSDESHRILAQDMAERLPGVTQVVNQLTSTAQAESSDADYWIVRKIKLALLFHSNVSANTTIVEAKNGIVTLKGEATSPAQRDLTGEYAKDIEGVTEVRNEMTIAAATETAQRTPAEQLDDASVSAQVKSALATHRSTSRLKTGIVTRDGQVTVTGVASNAAEKILVTKLVTDIQGVTAVDNQMTMAPGSSR